jgi:uncharacterized protein (DUF58 family)
MKKIFNRSLGLVLMFSLFFVILDLKPTNACEINFEILENKKDFYQAGDLITIKVVVTLTHRSCPVAMKSTKFSLSGLKMVSADEWQQTSTMVWERILKVEVVGNKKGKLTLSAVRECDKDGGYGSLILNYKSKK